MATPSAERDYYIDQIREKGFVSVPNHFAGADIDPLFINFRAVLEEVFPGGNPTDATLQIQDAFDVAQPGRDHDSHGFLEQRRIGKLNSREPHSRPATEDKDTLHFTPQTMQSVYAHFGGENNTPQTIRDLLKQCDEVYNEAVKQVLPIYIALGLDEVMVAGKYSPHENVHLLRVLRYHARQKSAGTFIGDGALASLHFDRGKFTAGIWESRSGLVGTVGDNMITNPTLTIEGLDAQAERALLSPIRHHSGYLKFFVGAGYQHLPPEDIEKSGNLPMLFHGVTNDNPGEERDAVVLFMNEHTGAPQNIGFSRYKHERAFAHMRKFLEDQAKERGLPVPPAIIGAETVAQLAKQRSDATR